MTAQHLLGIPGARFTVLKARKMASQFVKTYQRDRLENTIAIVATIIVLIQETPLSF